jgi:hypothetical protein
MSPFGQDKSGYEFFGKPDDSSMLCKFAHFVAKGSIREQVTEVWVVEGCVGFFQGAYDMLGTGYLLVIQFVIRSSMSCTIAALKVVLFPIRYVL